MDKDLIKKILEFRNKRDWEQFHTGEHLAKALIIEAAELLECFQWDNDVKDVIHLEEELADVFICAILLAEAYNLDIKEIILKKIAKNALKYPLK